MAKGAARGVSSSAVLWNLLKPGLMAFAVAAIVGAEPAGALAAQAETEARRTTFAVIATPALRKAGWVDLVEAEIAKLPGVRIADRQHLDAVAGELSAAAILGPGLPEKRLELGRLVKADALVILAEDDRGTVPATQPASATPGRAMARVVISDCTTGARLHVWQMPVGASDSTASNGRFNGFDKLTAGELGAGAAPDGPIDFPAAVAGAVARTRDRYPAGVKWVIGTSPFVNRGLTHDYDWFQDQFAALLNNALSLSPGVAVLETQEARSIGREQAIGGANAARIVPLIIEGEYEVTQTGAATMPANHPPAVPGLMASLTVTIADGKGDVQKIQRTIPIGAVPRFLTQEIPAAALSRAAFAERSPADAQTQFDALASRADTFSRLGTFAESIPLREAALLLRPDDVGQHWRLVDEYDRVSMGLDAPPMLTRGEQQRYAAARAAQWEAGLEHLEYLIRNRQVRRPQAVRAVSHYRSRYLSVVPDGPAPLRRFYGDVYPLVLALEPGQPSDYVEQPGRPLMPDVIDQMEKDAWLRTFFNSAADRTFSIGTQPLTSAEGVPDLLGDDAADFLADMIVRWFPDDIFAPMAAGQVFEQVPGSEQFPYVPATRPRSNPRMPAPAPQPALSDIDPRREATYSRFLDRVEKSGKNPYGFWVRFARLRMQCLREMRRSTARPTSADLLQKIDVLEQDYRGLKLHGNPPSPLDPLLLAVTRLRAQATGAPVPTGYASNPTGRPTAGTAVATSTGNRPMPGGSSPVSRSPTNSDKANPAILPAKQSADKLWYVPIPVQVHMLDGSEPRSLTMGLAPDAQQLVSAGPNLDVLWWSKRVLFWGEAGRIEEVFNVSTALRANPPDEPNPRNTAPDINLTDVQWDGVRAWVGCDLQYNDGQHKRVHRTGLAVIEADGKAVRWIGQQNGLPPADNALLIHPVSEGRVVVVGSFGVSERSWCALVDLGTAGERPRINVFHTAVAAPQVLPPDAGGADAPNNSIDAAFRPAWLAESRPSGVAGTGRANTPPDRLLLVGRGATRWPLVIDLNSLKVSVAAAPLGSDDRNLAGGVFAAAGDSLLAFHDGSLTRFPLVWEAAALKGASSPLVTRDDVGWSSYKERILPAGETVYLFRNDPIPDAGWLRYNIRSRQAEMIYPDYMCWRYGPCHAYGVSSRFGLVGWGEQVCRLVIAPARPAGALKRRLSFCLNGMKATYAADEPASVSMAPASAAPGNPAAAQLPPELAPPSQNQPTIDDLIGALDMRRSAFVGALSRIAALQPADYPPAQRTKVAAALLPLLSQQNPEIHERVMMAFAVWHAPESVAPLLAMLESGDVVQRRSALQALALCQDPGAIPQILHAFARDDVSALSCLAAIGPASEPAVLGLLQDCKPAARPDIVDCLALIGTARSVPRLREILDQHPDRETTERIRGALEMIQKTGPGSH